MKVDPENEKHLIADKGCELARIKNLNKRYTEVWLGKIVASDGTLEDDKAENFIEIETIADEGTTEEKAEETKE